MRIQLIGGFQGTLKDSFLKYYVEVEKNYDGVLYTTRGGVKFDKTLADFCFVYKYDKVFAFTLNDDELAAGRLLSILGMDIIAKRDGNVTRTFTNLETDSHNGISEGVRLSKIMKELWNLRENVSNLKTDSRDYEKIESCLTESLSWLEEAEKELTNTAIDARL